MCLLLIANEVHPKYKLIIAANRDEFYERPTAQADYWKDYPNLLAGRDLKEGGTWLGITKEGKISAITNYRDLSNIKYDAPTRGMLTTGFLTGNDSPIEYHKKLEQRGKEYNGFNLIFGTKTELYFFSNYSYEFTKIGKGIFGLSNCLLDTPWPKVEKSKSEMKWMLEERELQVDKIFKILSDTSIAADETLPDTGVGIQLERILSAIFIKSFQYGTRCSTVITIDNNDNVEFIENTYLYDKDEFSEVNYKFTIKAK